MSWQRFLAYLTSKSKQWEHFMIKEGVYVSVLQSHIIAECFCSREVAITTESITGANYLYRSNDTPNVCYLNMNSGTQSGKTTVICFILPLFSIGTALKRKNLPTSLLPAISFRLIVDPVWEDKYIHL